MIDANTVLARVRPRESLVRAGAVALVIGGIPLFGVLYWLSLAQGSWRRVLAVNVTVAAIALFAWIRHRRAYTEVGESQLVKQAYLRRRVVDRDRIASTLIAHTWRPGSSESIPQLLVLDRAGECLVRLRGTVWSLESMETIAEALGVPSTVETHTMTLREFYAEHPNTAYWYEGRPWITVAGIVAGFAVAFLATSWIMMAIGAPSALVFVP
ncbi:MAG: hypothetical protein U1E32_00645 [Rhodoglobus sp.]|jgi:hypothetical protein|nr:hypothetical protein [Rhodoglobus sp.]